MVAVSATEFANNFGLYREKAQEEAIAITSQDRTGGYFISAQEFEELQRLKSMARRVYHISELSDRTVEAISKARMDPAYESLNALLEEE